MKKIKIIIGSLLAIFLLMTLPSASAVEANSVKGTTNYSSEIPGVDFKKLKESYEKDNGEPSFIILYTLLIWLLKALRVLDFGIIIVLLSIIRKIIGNQTTEITV